MMHERMKWEQMDYSSPLVTVGDIFNLRFLDDFGRVMAQLMDLR